MNGDLEQTESGNTLAGLYWQSPFGNQALLILLCLVLATAARPWLQTHAKQHPCIGRSMALVLGVLSTITQHYWCYTTVYEIGDVLPSPFDPASWAGLSFYQALLGLMAACIDAVTHWRILRSDRLAGRIMMMASHGCGLACCGIPLRLLASL